MTIREEVDLLLAGFKRYLNTSVFVDVDTAAKILVEVGFTGWQVVTMNAIINPESERNALAIGPAVRRIKTIDAKGIEYDILDPTYPNMYSIDMGLFRINVNSWMSYSQNMGIDPLEEIKKLFDPLYNAQVARTIFVSRDGIKDPKRGYGAWNAYTAFATSTDPVRQQQWKTWVTESAAAARRAGVQL